MVDIVFISPYVSSPSKYTLPRATHIECQRTVNATKEQTNIKIHGVFFELHMNLQLSTFP